MNLPELDLIILKNLVTTKKHALEFANECDTKLFSTEAWNIANIIIGYVKTYKDIPTLKVIIERLSKGNNAKQIEYVKLIWDQLDKTVVKEIEFKHELDKFKNRFAERQIISMKEALAKQQPGAIDVNVAMKEMQKTFQSINSINHIKTYESKDVKDYLPIFVEKYNSKKDNPNFDRGIKTKYSFLDYATNGLKPADFVLIAGESGFGKSLFLQNIGIQTWLQDNTIDQIDNFTEGKNIIYFSLEMPYEDCFNRFLSRLSGVPSRDIENAHLDKNDFLKIKKCLDFISKYPYKFRIVDISDASANDIAIILNDCDEKFDAIFID